MSIEPCVICKKQNQIDGQAECLFCFIYMQNVCIDCIHDCICDKCLGLETRTNNNIESNVHSNQYFNTEIFSKLEDDESFTDSDDQVFGTTVFSEVKNELIKVDDKSNDEDKNKETGELRIEDDKMNETEEFEIKEETKKHDMIRFHDETEVFIEKVDSDIQSQNPFDSSSSDENILRNLKNFSLNSSNFSTNESYSPPFESEEEPFYSNNLEEIPRTEPIKFNDLLNLSESEFNLELQRALLETEALKKKMDALNKSVSVMPITVTSSDQDDTGFNFPVRMAVPNNTPVTGQKEVEEQVMDNQPKTIRPLKMMGFKYSPKVPSRDPEFLKCLAQVNQLTGDIENNESDEPKHFPLTLEKGRSSENKKIETSGDGKEEEKRKVNNLIAYYESLNK